MGPGSSVHTASPARRPSARALAQHMMRLTPSGHLAVRGRGPAPALVAVVSVDAGEGGVDQHFVAAGSAGARPAVAQSSLTPAARITLPHMARSAWMKAVNSAGVLQRSSPP